MKRPILAAALACAIALPVLAQDNPFSGFKGKIREGNWEYKMQMEGMPGMPQGMQMPTINRCITPADVDKGGFANKDGKMPDGCTVKNMKMSGNTASYTMECTKDPKMTVDSDITFGGDTFTMKQKMAMDRGGQMMNMTQTMTGRYTGPCTAKK
ncbi:hypothetical protein BWI17_17470 [Betaproteobacteria bacterium GR16-43]|nr:hypothetical protein BWI17_17470 [Betaproteobacteria bacterium GR16-43]